MNRDVPENNFDTEPWLDRALAEYAQVEPRTGFEGRVLARLQVEQEHSRRKTWWRLSFAFGAAAMFLLTLLWLRQPQATRVPGMQTSKVAPETEEPVETAKGSEGDLGQLAPLSQHPRARARARGGSPKGKHFPTALPLTDQERMLMQYVQDFPEKAALTAQAQTDLQKQNELEMAGPGPEKESKDLDRKQ